ncbi:hypothetical protein [Deinococcus misasensis]|uniref:hypothetical protein n=1 Tax=Deinococcus misasensis TaxID=392413 RepID=UPI0012F88356|nr:hypothetical protein [Deinococcus misasensis]
MQSERSASMAEPKYHAVFSHPLDTRPLVARIQGEHLCFHQTSDQMGWEIYGSPDLIRWRKKTDRMEARTPQRLWSGAAFEHEGQAHVLGVSIQHQRSVVSLHVRQPDGHWNLLSSPSFLWVARSPAPTLITGPCIYTEWDQIYCLMTAVFPSGRVAFVAYRMHTPDHWVSTGELYVLPEQDTQDLHYNPCLLEVDGVHVLLYHSPGTRTTYALLGSFREGRFLWEHSQVLQVGEPLRQPVVVSSRGQQMLQGWMASLEGHLTLSLPARLEVQEGTLQVLPAVYPGYLDRYASYENAPIHHQPTVFLLLKQAYLLRMQLPEDGGMVRVRLHCTSPAESGVLVEFDLQQQEVRVNQHRGPLAGRDVWFFVDGRWIEVFSGTQVMVVDVGQVGAGSFVSLEKPSGKEMAQFSLYEYRNV